MNPSSEPRAGLLVCRPCGMGSSMSLALGGGGPAARLGYPGAREELRPQRPTAQFPARLARHSREVQAQPQVQPPLHPRVCMPGPGSDRETWFPGPLAGWTFQITLAHAPSPASGLLRGGQTGKSSATRLKCQSDAGNCSVHGAQWDQFGFFSSVPPGPWKHEPCTALRHWGALGNVHPPGAGTGSPRGAQGCKVGNPGRGGGRGGHLASQGSGTRVEILKVGVRKGR